MNRTLASTVVLAAGLHCTAACAAQCLLPNPDGGPWLETSSKPSFEGHVVKANEEEITVLKKDGTVHDPQTARIGPHTQIYGSGGGWVDPKELSAGNYARVWLESCKPFSKKRVLSAAVIMLN